MKTYSLVNIHNDFTSVDFNLRFLLERNY